MSWRSSAVLLILALANDPLVALAQLDTKPALNTAPTATGLQSNNSGYVTFTQMVVITTSAGDYTLETNKFYTVLKELSNTYKIAIGASGSQGSVYVSKRRCVYHTESERKSPNGGKQDIDEVVRRLNQKYQAESNRRYVTQPARNTYNIRVAIPTPVQRSWTSPIDDTERAVGRTAQGRTIYTGPRGGRYYYSSSGSKVYVDY